MEDYQGVSRGFGLVETLIATAVIACSSLVFLGALGHLAHSKLKNQVVKNAMSVESDIVTALANPATFPPAVQTFMLGASTGNPPGLAVRLEQGESIPVGVPICLHRASSAI